jgi:TonB-linked SusC/RagA family outer membrane protein
LGGAAGNSAARNAYGFANLKQPYWSKTNFLNAALLLSYNISSGLSASVNFGYNNASITQSQVMPIASLDQEQNPTGSENWGYNNNRNWIIEPQLTYNRLVGRGKLSVLLGASSQKTNTDGVLLYGYGFTNDNLLGSLSNAPSLSSAQSIGQYRYAAVFGRITYNWTDKYIVNVNARRDGSSRFGPDKQYGNFGSVGAGYIFSEEAWFKRHLPVLSFGKIRASYGTTGSDAVGDYQYLTQYSSTGTFPYGGVTSLRPTIEANPDYHWQVNRKLEIAVNAGFLQDRISVQIAYYRNSCGNQLISFPLPTLTGFSSVTANSLALVRNEGFEYTALFKIIGSKKFTWSIDFNCSFNRNKLLAYPDLAHSPFAGKYVIGQSLNMQRLLHYTGVDPLTGQFTFEDRNHDGQITDDFAAQTSDDNYYVNLSPKFLGGLGMNFSYQSISVSLFFNFIKQKGVNAFVASGIPGILYNNMPMEVFNRWQNPGDIKPYAAFTQNPSTAAYDNFYSQSDGVYTDASYIRLSNLSLTYTVNDAYLKKMGLRGCSVFVNANNLLTITNYKGLDPETQSYTGLPPTRTIVGGLSFQF